jgi:hypothetical protein
MRRGTRAARPSDGTQIWSAGRAPIGHHVRMVGIGRRVSMLPTATNMPTRGRSVFSLFSKFSGGRVKACHPIAKVISRSILSKTAERQCSTSLPLLACGTTIADFGPNGPKSTFHRFLRSFYTTYGLFALSIRLYRSVKLWSKMGMKRGVTFVRVECIPRMEGWPGFAKSGQIGSG